MLKVQLHQCEIDDENRSRRSPRTIYFCGTFTRARFAFFSRTRVQDDLPKCESHGFVIAFDATIVCLERCARSRRDKAAFARGMLMETAQFFQPPILGRACARE